MKPKHSLNQVVNAIREVAAEFPSRVDARAGRGLAPRYVEHGKPCCLVAEVLVRLGWSVSQLKTLDREYGTGDHGGTGGVQLNLSRNPLLRRIDPLGLDLLNHIQRRQDRRFPWSEVVAEAFQETPYWRHQDAGFAWLRLRRFHYPWVREMESE